MEESLPSVASRAESSPLEAYWVNWRNIIVATHPVHHAKTAMRRRSMAFAKDAYGSTDRLTE